MKRSSVFWGLLFIGSTLRSPAQVQIRQIEHSVTDQLEFLMSEPLTSYNVSQIQQIGNHNNTRIQQSGNSGLSAGNQAYSFQQGNSNTASMYQNGADNQLYSMQVSYACLREAGLTSFLPGGYNQPDLQVSLSSGESSSNVLNALQKGSANTLRVLQIGSENTIGASQKGHYNNLLIQQIGTNNTVSNYWQTNTSGTGLFDSIIQLGDNLSLSTDYAAPSARQDNNYYQQGKDLSLTISSDLMLQTGGIKVSQTGIEMNVTIVQSYFPKP